MKVVNKLSKDQLEKLLKVNIAAFNRYRKNTTWCRIDLSDIDLSGVNLKEADLKYANLSRANLSRANLSNANLSGAFLNGTNLSDADLSGAVLRGANLLKADLWDATLSDADLSDTNLSDADLSDADLSDTNLSDADLRDTNFDCAILNNTNLNGANLSGANLSGAKGLLSNEDLLDKYFLKDEDNWIVYKAFGNTTYDQPDHWKLKSGNIIDESNLNSDRGVNCGSGVNFATFEWIIQRYGKAKEIWKCEVDLSCDAIMPYSTDGKGRCRKLKLIERVK